MNIGEPQERELIAQEAAEWFVANDEPGDAARQSLFEAWLEKSPTHLEEYLEISQLAQDLRVAGQPESSIATPAAGARLAPDPRVGRPTPVRKRPPVLQAYWLYAAAATVVVGVFGLALLWPASRALFFPGQVTVMRFATQHGEMQTQRLPDASVLHLNTDTSVVVRYSRLGRRVDIERGQAVFEVQHDPGRPFQVFAGSAKVVDVGTRFDVYRQEDSTLVTVVEGKVLVGAASWLDRMGFNATWIGAGRPVLVTAGQQVRITSNEVQIPVPANTQRVIAWVRGQIVFEQLPLAAVAEQFNRYISKPIEIDSAALRRLRISGSFATGDVDAFIAVLRRLDGVQVEVTSTRIRVSKT